MKTIALPEFGGCFLFYYIFINVRIKKMSAKITITSFIAVTSFYSNSLAGFYVIKESSLFVKRLPPTVLWIAPRSIMLVGIVSQKYKDVNACSIIN